MNHDDVRDDGCQSNQGDCSPAGKTDYSCYVVTKKRGEHRERQGSCLLTRLVLHAALTAVQTENEINWLCVPTTILHGSILSHNHLTPFEFGTACSWDIYERKRLGIAEHQTRPSNAGRQCRTSARSNCASPFYNVVSNQHGQAPGSTKR